MTARSLPRLGKISLFCRKFMSNDLGVLGRRSPPGGILPLLQKDRSHAGRGCFLAFLTVLQSLRHSSPAPPAGQWPCSRRAGARDRGLGRRAGCGGLRSLWLRGLRGIHFPESRRPGPPRQKCLGTKTSIYSRKECSVPLNSRSHNILPQK